jgi:mannose-1-phosphate guanylyltransferase
MSLIIDKLKNELDSISVDILKSIGIEGRSEDVFNFVHFTENCEEGSKLDENLHYLLTPPKDVGGFLFGMKRYLTTYFQYKNTILKEVHQKLEWIQTDKKLIELLKQNDTYGKNDLHKK